MAKKKAAVEAEVEVPEVEAEAELPEVEAEASAEPEAPVEKKGKEVKIAPAHVSTAPVRVRGTSVGGTKVMSAEEHAKWCEETRKKAAKG